MLWRYRIPTLWKAHVEVWPPRNLLELLAQALARAKYDPNKAWIE
jgi:hypothetical protein